MEHTLYACELPYPEVEAAPCLADAKLLMPDYGGPQGELTAVTTYCFQHYITSASRPELAEALAGIAKVEMRHHALLGETVFKLGGYPVMGGGCRYADEREVQVLADHFRQVDLAPSADSEDEVISVCLTTCSESRRDTLNLVRHPENKGKRVAVFGVQETYLKLPGIKHIDALEFPAG